MFRAARTFSMSLPERFVSCDWGTSSFRLRLVGSEALEPRAELSVQEGIRSIHDRLAENASAPEREAAFAGFLGTKLDELLFSSEPDNDVIPVMLSGMASSTIGWRELPYAEAPLALDGSNLIHERIRFATPAGLRIELFLVSGARTANDIMRGEETEALGVLNHPDFAGFAEDSLLLLPGTHCKHMSVRDGAIVGWRTFMTGELFEALTSATILRQTAGEAEDGNAGGQFQEGVAAGFQAGMEPRLFQARVRGVLGAATNAANRAWLSGLLIGSELRHAETTAAERPVLVVGSGRLAARYREAAETCARVSPSFPKIVPVELPEGSAAVRGHAFLLNRWRGGAETDPI